MKILIKDGSGRSLLITINDYIKNEKSLLSKLKNLILQKTPLRIHLSTNLKESGYETYNYIKFVVPMVSLSQMMPNFTHNVKNTNDNKTQCNWTKPIADEKRHYSKIIHGTLECLENRSILRSRVVLTKKWTSCKKKIRAKKPKRCRQRII